MLGQVELFAMPAIDTHQHLWDPERFSYSWMAGVPSLSRRSLMKEYNLAISDVLGSVYVDTDVDERDLADETAMIFAMADDPKNRLLGVVAGARLESNDCFQHFAPFWDHPKLKGVRRVLHTQRDEIFRDSQFLENLDRIVRRGLSFDLCVQPRQLPLARELVQRHPEATFILDHCGSPDVRSGALDPWREHLEEIAKQQNVFCKVSGLVAYADPGNCSADVLSPYVEHVIQSFGWDRVLWGSDWPVCTLTCSLERWWAITLELTARASESEKKAFFIENARRVYRL